MADEFKKGLEDLERGPGASDAADSAAAGQAGGANADVDALRERFGDAVGTYVVMSGNENVVFVEAASAYAALEFLKNERGFDLCKDISAIDYGGNRPLEVFYELWSIKGKRQLRVKAVLPLNALEIDSVVALWQTADWLERETYDMFGINFRNHPDLRRILMPDNYAEGHPLRKDFPLRGRFSRAEQTRRALTMDVEDYYTPHEMDVGGQPAAQGDGAAREGAEPDWKDGVDNEKDPAFGDVPVTQRAPVPGGEATAGQSGNE